MSRSARPKTPWPATSVKRNRFVQVTGATKAVNRDLEAKARALAGIKGYVTNITDPNPELVIGAYRRLLQVEKSFRMAKSDLAARPIYARTRDSIEAHLSIVFAAIAVGRWIEETTSWSLRKFVKTARRYRTIEITLGNPEQTGREGLWYQRVPPAQLAASGGRRRQCRTGRDQFRVGRVARRHDAHENAVARRRAEGAERNASDLRILVAFERTPADELEISDGRTQGTDDRLGRVFAWDSTIDVDPEVEPVPRADELRPSSLDVLFSQEAHADGDLVHGCQSERGAGGLRRQIELLLAVGSPNGIESPLLINRVPQGICVYTKAVLTDTVRALPLVVLGSEALSMLPRLSRCERGCAQTCKGHQDRGHRLPTHGHNLPYGLSQCRGSPAFAA